MIPSVAHKVEKWIAPSHGCIMDVRELQIALS
jgi:hypothetical protein